MLLMQLASRSLVSQTNKTSTLNTPDAVVLVSMPPYTPGQALTEIRTTPEAPLVSEPAAAVLRGEQVATVIENQ